MSLIFGVKFWKKKFLVEIDGQKPIRSNFVESELDRNRFYYLNFYYFHLFYLQKGFDLERENFKVELNGIVEVRVPAIII